MKALLLSFLVFSLLLFLSSSSSHVLLPHSTESGSKTPVAIGGDDRASPGDQRNSPSKEEASWDDIGMENYGEDVEVALPEEEEGVGFVEGRRMIIENTDYPGTGANNRHDPKPPATG